MRRLTARAWTTLPLAACLLAAASCSRPAPDPPPPPAAESAPAASRPAAARPKVVVLGDSLTAGLGLAAEESFPSILQRRIDEAGLAFEVVNAGVSGDTSAGGLRRLDWSIEPDTRVLIVALGANDGLRGLSVEEMSRNLSRIIERALAKGLVVILAGMEAPPNYGSEYAEAFREAYRSLAARHRVPLVPFLLAGVAGESSLNQPDGIHPNARGAERVADTVWSELRPALERLTSS